MTRKSKLVNLSSFLWQVLNHHCHLNPRHHRHHDHKKKFHLASKVAPWIYVWIQICTMQLQENSICSNLKHDVPRWYQSSLKERCWEVMIPHWSDIKVIKVMISQWSDTLSPFKDFLEKQLYGCHVKSAVYFNHSNGKTVGFLFVFIISFPCVSACPSCVVEPWISDRRGGKIFSCWR